VPSIVLIGQQGSGKTAVAQALADLTLGDRRSFADPLRREVAVAVGRRPTAEIMQEMQDRETKEQWRPLLQAWGQRRRDTDVDYWVRRFQAQLTGADTFVDDCRYPNEYAFLRRAGFICVKLLPEPHAPRPDETHLSEQYWQDFPTHVQLRWLDSPEARAERLKEELYDPK
jgi:hypothetical protein